MKRAMKSQSQSRGQDGKVRVGVLGGTFDPIHVGHLAIARAARETHRLDRVILVPAYAPPHKREGLTDYAHRHAMAEIAARSLAGAQVSDCERRRRGVSYTVDTLRQIAGESPGAELFFIIGEDSILELPLWKDLPGIFSLARIVAVNRPGPHRRFETRSFPGIRAEVLERCEEDRVAMEPVPVASRELRERIAAGEGCESLLPDGVGDYIRSHGLYGTAKENERRRK